jgi:hypothetical protein
MSENPCWRNLIRLRRWTSIHEIGYGSQQVRDFLFRIQRNCYVTAVDHDARFNPSHSRLITSLLWAESEGAALRAALMDIEADEPTSGVEIPTEMLFHQELTSYGSIKEALKTRIDGTLLEHADYRIAIDGAFVHRVLSSRTFEFYFRSVAEKPNEIPYAIKRRLKT